MGSAFLDFISDVDVTDAEAVPITDIDMSGQLQPSLFDGFTDQWRFGGTGDADDTDLTGLISGTLLTRRASCTLTRSSLSITLSNQNNGGMTSTLDGTVDTFTMVGMFKRPVIDGNGQIVMGPHGDNGGFADRWTDTGQFRASNRYAGTTTYLTIEPPVSPAEAEWYSCAYSVNNVTPKRRSYLMGYSGQGLQASGDEGNGQKDGTVNFMILGRGPFTQANFNTPIACSEWGVRLNYAASVTELDFYCRQLLLDGRWRGLF